MEGKEKEQKEPVTLAAVEEKVTAGAALSPEEEKVFLEGDGPVEGYMHEEHKEENPDDHDGGEATKDGDEGEDPDKKNPEDSAKESKADEEKPGTEDVFVKLERELSKPEGKEDLSQFSQRERAYFFQMRKDRKRAQLAEGERDAAQRKTLKLEKDLESVKETKSKEVVEDPLADLKKKDPTDFLTVAEVTSLLEKVQATKKPDDKKPDENNSAVIDQRQMKYLTMCEKEARDAHPEDFDLVMELTEDVINANPQHLIVIAKEMASGGNPALKAYELIKSDPDFNNLITVAKTKQEAAAGKKDPQKKEDTTNKEQKKEAPKVDPEKAKRVQKTEDALNKKQVKTTGSIDKGSDSVSDDVSFEEMANMSDLEFARLPKAKRNEFLKKMKDL